MATENISIIMLERMWELLSGIVADKTGTADAKLEAAIAAANGVGVVLDTSGATAAANAINAIIFPDSIVYPLDTLSIPARAD